MNGVGLAEKDGVGGTKGLLIFFIIIIIIGGVVIIFQEGP